MEDNILSIDPAHVLVDKFFKSLLPDLKCGSVLEVGARARSGVSRKALVPKRLQYCGFDIVEGPNVDVVGDAHRLSQFFESGSIDAIFSMSVFEHLAMPWKVALESNKVLKLGGIMMHTTHQAWPLHEHPWDYWRYSNDTWKCIFNNKTGFKILDVAMGEPAHIKPVYSHAAVAEVEIYPAYLMSVVICKKISQSKLDWDVDIQEILDSNYPN